MYKLRSAGHIILILLAEAYVLNAIGSTTSSFYISFQRSKNLSTEEWAEYKGDMPELKEFTACHWDKPTSFNDQINTIWGYCVKVNNSEKIDCFQLLLSLDPSTANRQAEIYSTVDYRYNNKRGFIELRNKTIRYKHRKWQHYCWMYSSITGENAMYFNGNMIASKTIPRSHRTVWRGTQIGVETAFIIAQEQDKIRGGYQRTQVFTGDIAEVNIWDYPLNKTKIKAMANCKIRMKGNVKSWKIGNLEIRGAIVVNISDTQMFCEAEKRLIIFPTRKPLSMAKSICTIHGGKIVTPSSDKENKEVIEVVKKHHKNCIDTKNTNKRNWGKLTWLGVKRSDAVWYDVQGDDLRQPINYSRWLTHFYKNNVDCAYLQSDGSWYYGLTGECPYENLCTVCSVTDTPVFTLKGVCDASGLDWNYYMNVDAKNEINNYEGYKNNRIFRFNNRTWGSESNSYRISLASTSKLNFPIGRQIWSSFDENCKESDTKYLTLSRCEFGNEFTCTSGHCIDIERKCDGHVDCMDNSDEEQCSYIRIPNTYKKVDAPATNISTHVLIERIHDINTIEMMVELTTVVYMQWYDHRLTFTNLRYEQKHLISDVISKQIWTPFDRLVHERALIGKTFLDRMQVYIKAKEPPMNMDKTDAIEDRLFDGSKNIIIARHRARSSYDCTFELRYFPFDTQICQFKSLLDFEKDSKQNFISNRKSVEYLGPQIANDFKIQKIEVVSGMNRNQTYFMFTITLDRKYSSQILSIFFPTLLIWFMAYLTFFIDLRNFNNRFMGSVTSLLVLSSLLNSMQNSLPKTAYFKYVDAWFSWYITNSIFMIATHVLLDNIPRVESSISKIMVMSCNHDDTLTRCKTLQNRMNQVAIILFPALSITFNVLYFTLHLI